MHQTKWQIGLQGPATPKMQGLSFTLCAGCAGVYRKEQWQVPLAAALLELRECAQRQHKHKVYTRAGSLRCLPGNKPTTDLC